MNKLAFMRPSAALKTWFHILILIAAVILLLLLQYRDTFSSIVQIWLRSDTFTHGFLIIPISLWLIWRKRHQLGTIRPRPYYLGSLALFALGFTWLLGYLAGVLVVQQYSLILMIPVLVITLLGVKMAAALAFPLAFLLLAVPFGEILLPPLMEFTADFTIFALQLTGIPVYREGLFFTVPSGSWSVVEACSGLRYLIASFTLGCLYAYLTYRSLRRRLIFVALSILVPILANGLRAYMIVMIGHLSDMRYAVGVDHLIYGWLFFGIVMLIMFWIGARWREDVAPTVAHPPSSGNLAAIPLRPIAISAAGALLATLIWPLYAAHLQSRASVTPVKWMAPQARTWLPHPQPLSSWQPVYSGSALNSEQTYAQGNNKVSLRIYYYRGQKQEAEMVSSVNVLVASEDQQWGRIADGARKVSLVSGKLEVNETQLRSATQHLLVWHWYWINGETTRSPFRAKWLQAKAQLLQAKDDAAFVLVATPLDENTETARAVLAGFLNEMAPAIEASLAHAARP